jgi:hypothetical protein
MAWFSRRSRWTRLVAPKIAVGDDWYAARLSETRRRVDVPESAVGETSRKIEERRTEGEAREGGLDC